MIDISIHELSGKSSLLTRGTADQILSRVAVAKIDSDSPVVIDFKNVVAVAPSFFDQFIGGLKLKISPRYPSPIVLRFLEVPTHASEKFAAVGRSHNMVLHQTSDREWFLVESVE